ncbi:hypothetical protein C5L38_33495 [Streptomyces sp. WAC00288]|nr:hypothetical protein C5L38_33495 [Streptomyces sp. WAC00288]KYG50765.1 hypothetical protein AWI43_33165 [Streptomyces sp. WAC04657]
MTAAVAEDADMGRTPASHGEEEKDEGRSLPLATLLIQACRTVLDGQIMAMSAGLESAARTLLTCDDDGRPQPAAQLAAAGPAHRARHVALADLCGWPLYSVESARIVLHLTTPMPPGPDGVLRCTIATTTATATMTATIHLSTRPNPRPLADDLAAAALTPAPPTIDSDRLSATARRAVTAWRHLPSLYRGIDQMSAEAPGHTAIRAVEDLADAVCTWCAGGPPVKPRLITDAPRPETLDPDAPPTLIALATTVARLRSALSTTNSP